MGLLSGESCMILTSSIFDWSTRVSVTDRHTDGRVIAYTRYSIYAVACKNLLFCHIYWKFITLIIRTCQTRYHLLCLLCITVVHCHNQNLSSLVQKLLNILRTNTCISKSVFIYTLSHKFSIFFSVFEFMFVRSVIVMLLSHLYVRVIHNNKLTHHVIAFKSKWLTTTW